MKSNSKFKKNFSFKKSAKLNSGNNSKFKKKHFISNNSRNNNSRNNNSRNNNTNRNNSKDIFCERYDNFFGKGTFDKLIYSKREYSNNSFIRINLSKISISDVESFLRKNRVKYSKTFIDNFLKIEKSFFNLSSSLLSLFGQIYIQDLASGVPISLIDFQKLKNLGRKIKILDVGASPGSKTTQLADLLIYNGIDYSILCIEPNKLRLTKLINNIQKQEFKNIEVLNIAGEDFNFEDKFDLIILDVPCSGNLIDDKDWLNKRDIKGIEKNSSLQKKLIKNISKYLLVGGELIYSTCSLEPEENELNIDWTLKNTKLKTKKVLKKFPFEVKPLSKIDIKNLKDNNSIRLMPYNSKTQGFFVCKFENK